MDYDDLLLQWGRLIREFPEQREIHGRMFRHILIDEMQDTNAVQVDVVEAIAAAGAGQPHGRRRRRPVDLPVPRRRLRQHPPVPRTAPRREALPARCQLPIDAPDRRLHPGLDRPQPDRVPQGAGLRAAERRRSRWSSPPRTPMKKRRSSARRSSNSATRGWRSGRWRCSIATTTTASCSRGSCWRAASLTRCAAGCGSSSRPTSRTCWRTSGSSSTRATKPPGDGCSCSCRGSGRPRPPRSSSSSGRRPSDPSRPLESAEAMALLPAKSKGFFAGFVERPPAAPGHRPRAEPGRRDRRDPQGRLSRTPSGSSTSGRRTGSPTSSSSPCWPAGTTASSG